MDLTPQPVKSRIVAPALVGLLPKSIYGDVDEARVRQLAIRAARGVTTPLPVCYGPDNRVIGTVFAPHAWSREVVWVEGDRRPLDRWRAAITTYEAFKTAAQSNKRWTASITSLATAAPGAANCWYDLWYVQGSTGGPVTPGSSKVADSYDDGTGSATQGAAGSVWHGGSVGTSRKHLLSIWAIASAGAPPPLLMLYDRVLVYPLCGHPAIAGTAQSMDNTNPALRHISAGQSGLQIFMANIGDTHLTPGAVNGLTYVGMVGGAGKTMPTTRAVNIIASQTGGGTNLGSIGAAPYDAAGTVQWGPFLPLATGESGIVSITDYTMSANSATEAAFYDFVCLRPLAYVPTYAANGGTRKNLIYQTANVERVFNGAHLQYLAFFPTTTGATIRSTFDTVWG